MSTQRLSTGTQFCWHNEFFEIRRRLADSKVVIVNLVNDETTTVAFADLFKALFSGDLVLSSTGKLQEKARKSPYVDLSDCPKELRSIAEFRLSVIQPLLDMSRGERFKAIEQRVEEIKAEHQTSKRSLVTSVSIPSVYRWLRDYEQSSRDVRVLIPATEKRGGRNGSRLDKDVKTIIETTLADHYFVRVKRTINYFHREIAVRIADENRQRLPGEQLKVPSRATVAREIDKLDEAEKLTAKRGRRKARQLWKQYGNTDFPTMPLERVEVDHTQVDLIVADEEVSIPLGRPWLTICYDRATRYPLGYHVSFEPPSYLSVMSCLLNSIQPKENIRERYGTEHDWQAFGVPGCLVTDNGREFIGRDLEDACTQLKIDLQRSPVKEPHFKGGIERLFGTLNSGLFHGLPGTTFSNHIERGDYGSLAHASIALSELDRILHIYLLDMYAETFHRGLNGIPARKWEAAIRDGFFPQVPTSPRELRIILGRVESRTIQHYGVELHSLRYNCDALLPLRSFMNKRDDKLVKVKYDPANLGSIYVLDPDRNEYIDVPSLAPEYAQGLSLWKHRVILNELRKSQLDVSIENLGRAQRKIQSIVDESLQRKKHSGHSKEARWNGGRASGSADISTSNEANTQPMSTTLDIDLDLDGPEDSGWEVSFDLPR